MKHIQCNLGIWNKREMQTFVQVLSDNYQWNIQNWLKIISKNFLNKSPENCSNFYYTLKSAGLSFRNRTFKQSSNFFKSTTKSLCENCINKLWKQSNQNQKTTNLCALCKLYRELYGKQRPNAQALSESFDLSFLSSKKT
uniref:Myb-like domain-containing protein n=1 Tax=Panagrolaimus superbus TaxID=310955 RepID=A0A914Y801_9BILA